MAMDTVKWTLETALAREGKEVTDHTGTVHKVLFRRNKDKNSTDDYLTLFAPYDSDIEQGETLALDDSILIVLNSETESGRQYRRIDVIKANAYVTLCYVGEMMDEKFDIITTDIPYAENVPIFITSGLTARRLSDITSKDLQFIVPARYGFTMENTVKMSILTMNSSNKFRTIQGIFQPSTIDYHLMTVCADGSHSGLLTVRGSADLRPRD